MNKNNIACNEFLIFSIGVNCPLGCKICGIEKAIENYKGVKTMSLETFVKCVRNIPNNITIVFSGFNEPFLNRNIIEMLYVLNNKGFKIGVYTTLFNATVEKMKIIRHIDFEFFTVHLPDGKFLRFMYNEEYGKSLHYVMNNFKNVSYFTMRDFVNVGNVGYDNYKRFGRCIHYDFPQMSVYPDGHVEGCCQSIFFKGHNLGSLLIDDYETIRKRFYKDIPFKFCNLCKQYDNYAKWFYLKFLKSKISNVYKSVCGNSN